MISLFEKAERLYQTSVDGNIAVKDMAEIAEWPQDGLSVLFSCADQVRSHFFGRTVEPCGIMNIKSGGCTEDCTFCSQSARHTTGVDITQLSGATEIVARYHAAREHDLDFCLVSSGRRLSPREIGMVVDAVRQCGGPVHASLGILAFDELRQLKEAGVACYNHNLESSRAFFPRICTTHAWDDRIATVRAARQAGLEICCGGIFGLGESWQDRISLCQELLTLDVHCIPINFFNAIPGTKAAPSGESPLDLLKIVSLFRLSHPNAVIKVAGGREANLGVLQPLIFLAGANSYISGGYLTTGGAGVDQDDVMIAALGLAKTRRE
jgi:biotin synthase